MERFVTKTFIIKPEHETAIKRVARANGDASASAGLRSILDEWAQLKALTSALQTQAMQQPAPAPLPGG